MDTEKFDIKRAQNLSDAALNGLISNASMWCEAIDEDQMRLTLVDSLSDECSFLEKSRVDQLVKLIACKLIDQHYSYSAGSSKFGVSFEPEKTKIKGSTIAESSGVRLIMA